MVEPKIKREYLKSRNHDPLMAFFFLFSLLFLISAKPRPKSFSFVLFRSLTQMGKFPFHGTKWVFLGHLLSFEYLSPDQCAHSSMTVIENHRLCRSQGA